MKLVKNDTQARPLPSLANSLTLSVVCLSVRQIIFSYFFPSHRLCKRIVTFGAAVIISLIVIFALLSAIVLSLSLLCLVPSVCLIILTINLFTDCVGTNERGKRPLLTWKFVHFIIIFLELVSSASIVVQVKFVAHFDSDRC